MKPSSKRALFVGRFQPFHLGHVHAVRHILKHADEVIIVIGSAQYSHTNRNPFTAGERISMIRLALSEAGIDPARYIVVPVRDVNVHNVWVAHIISQTPSFSEVFTNEQLTARLFREVGYSVSTIPFHDRNSYSATEIRNRVLNGGDWKSLVPKSVYEYITQISGEDRIRDVVSSDMPSSPERHAG